MFDDSGTALTFPLSGFSRRSHSTWTSRLGGNDPDFPVTMIRGRDTAGGECMLKTSRGTGLVAALMGATFLLMVLTNPRVEPLRVPDVLKLVASGMFLGVGLAGLLGMLNVSNSRKDQSRPPRNE